MMQCSPDGVGFFGLPGVRLVRYLARTRDPDLDMFCLGNWSRVGRQVAKLPPEPWVLIPFLRLRSLGGTDGDVMNVASLIPECISPPIVVPILSVSESK